MVTAAIPDGETAPRAKIPRLPGEHFYSGDLGIFMSALTLWLYSLQPSLVLSTAPTARATSAPPRSMKQASPIESG